MKNLRNIITSIALIAFLGVNAQNNQSVQIKKETMIKQYDLKDGDKNIEYTLKVDTKAMNEVTLEASDRNKREQDRVLPPMEVTKVISIKSEKYPIYNNILEVTYKSDGNDNFRIQPTSNGFVLSAVGKDMNYYLLRKDYEIEKDYKDFFKVVGSETDK